MEKPPENSKFLGEKYNNLHTSKEVVRAVSVSEEPVPQKKEAQINAYLERLERVLGKEPEGKGYLSGEERLESLLMKDFVLDVQNEDTIIDLARALYESEKKIAIERGQGGQIEVLESSDNELLDKYKNAILEKHEIQKKTLDSWFTYLKQNDAEYPIWFRYFVVRSLKNMGQFSRDEMRYANRTPDTIAPFPEFNAEALGFVKKAIETQLEIDGIKNDDKKTGKKKQELKQEKLQAYLQTVKLDEERQVELEKELTKRLEGKDFAKLYAFAQVETAGSLNRESLDGQWKKYAQNSNYRLLENELQGKGTGWCTAEGSAKGQIEQGDFYVYYTKSDVGMYTEPRIAIRMAGGAIAEVRGVNPKQELEPELVDTAKEMYKDLPGSEKYEKADHDMKLMTSIYNKCFITDRETGNKVYLNRELSKEELIFLYEIDNKIDGFGYEQDPRIAELRGERNTTEDACIAFDCTKEQIATNANEITKDTKAYIGPLEKGIFEKHLSMEYIYTSFPDKRIQSIEIKSGIEYPKTKDEWVKVYKDRGVSLERSTEEMLEKMERTILAENQKFVQLAVADLGFSDITTYEKICAKAEELGLELCAQDDGPKLRLSYDQPTDDYIRTAMKSIEVSDDYFRLWYLGRERDGESGLRWSYGRDVSEWYPDHRFIFRVRK